MAEATPSKEQTPAQDAASSRTLTKGSRIVGDQRDALGAAFAKRYAAGESIRSLAVETGRSYGFVHGVLKESGANLRGRGGAVRAGSRPAEAFPDQSGDKQGAKKNKKSKRVSEDDDKAKNAGKTSDKVEKKPGKKRSKKG